MLRKSVILIVVMVMLVSFTAAVSAEVGDEGKAINNKAGVRILVDEDNDGVKEIHFLDAVPDHAEENGTSDNPDNPIMVAGN